jgi:hypothetical protein
MEGLAAVVLAAVVLRTALRGRGHSKTRMPLEVVGGEDRSAGMGEVSTSAAQQKAAYGIVINQRPTTPPAASDV